MKKTAAVIMTLFLVTVVGVASYQTPVVHAEDGDRP